MLAEINAREMTLVDSVTLIFTSIYGQAYCSCTRKDERHFFNNYIYKCLQIQTHRSRGIFFSLQCVGTTKQKFLSRRASSNLIGR